MPSGAGALLIGLGLVTVAVYAPAVGYGPVYDDARWLSWAQWHLWVTNPPRTAQACWLWLAQAPWMVAIGIGGGWVWPARVLAIGLHLLNGALLAQVARQWCSEAATVLIVGVFWLHPAQVESVAYLSGAREALVVAGALLAAVGWWSGRRVGLVVGAVALLLAAAVKPSARPVLLVTPLVLAGLTWDARGWRWLSLVGVAALLTAPLDGALRWAWSLVTLLARLAWPVGFAVVHDAPQGVVGPMVALAVVSVAGVVAWRSRWGWWAWVWVVGLTAPRALVTDAPPLTEHHLYGPVLAVWVLAGAGLDRLTSKEHACLIST